MVAVVEAPVRYVVIDTLPNLFLFDMQLNLLCRIRWLSYEQGAPSGIDGGRSGRFPANGAVRPKALWPVIGLRHPGDRVTMSSKWMTTYGADGASVVKNALAVDEILCAYERPSSSPSSRLSLPKWFVEESFHECESSFTQCFIQMEIQYLMT